MKKTITVLIEPILTAALILLDLVFKQPVFSILAIVIGGYKQTTDGVKDSFENKRLNVELLMILSAIGATIIGNALEGAILIFIFSLSGSLETLTLDRSKREISSIMNLQPTSATLVCEDGSTKVVAVDTLHIGQELLVSVGETVPIDGVIVQGSSSLEEASITGESVPASKSVGDLVYGGTLNVTHPLRIKVTSEVSDTMIQKIVKMVEDAQRYPSKVGRFIDRLEDVYARIVLVVVALVILVAWTILKMPFHDAFYKGMVLLVVASPCALIASVTPATLSAISNGARRGILVKGGVHFENLVDVKAISFDKTGTITEGVFSMTDISRGNDDIEVLEAIVAIEQYSSHPLANAVVQGVNRQFDLERVEEPSEVEENAGNGIRGVYKNEHYRIGKYSYMTSEDTTIHERGIAYANQGKSIIYVERNNKLVAVIGLMDKIRSNVKDVIAKFNDYGIQTIMITGDNAKTAKTVADQVGIKQVIAETVPSQKAEAVMALEKQYGVTMMIGDGINDAPALANATIGVAMGSGTDIAMETADIVLMHDNLENVEYAYRLSKRLRKIVTQNIIFSLSVILILVCANFVADIGLSLGVVGHEGSTILVILNSLRLLKRLD